MYVIETRAQVAAKAKAQAATQVGTSEQGDDVQEPLLYQEDLLSQIKEKDQCIRDLQSQMEEMRQMISKLTSIAPTHQETQVESDPLPSEPEPSRAKV